MQLTARLVAGAAVASAVVASAVVASALASPVRGAARAGHDVRGQVTVTERDGATPANLAETVLYLEPVAVTAALAASAAPNATPNAAPDPVPLATEISMRGREFVPHVRIVAAGGEVAFPNDDPFSHNVFSNTETNAFDLGLYRSHASRSARFARPGVYPIYCNIHHRMVSFVVAVASPYATMAARDGRFTIADVPAGAYVLHAWHERAGDTARPLTVGGGGADDVRLALDARGYVATAHPNKFGLPYAATRADRY